MSYQKSESIEQLATALAIAQGAIQGAIKDSVNPAFGAPRKYADLASCWDACRGPLSANGLAIIQAVSTEGPGVTISTMLTHKSGQWVSSSLTMTPEKGTPQGLGSAITYARRYSLSAMVGIAPADDDDGNEASGAPKGSRKAQEEVANRKITEMQTKSEPAVKPAKDRPTTQNFDFLSQARDYKQAIGEAIYRRVLTGSGFEKANQVVTVPDQTLIVKKWGAAKIIVDSSSHGELHPKCNEDIFNLLPDTGKAAIINGYKEKLAGVCGTEVAMDEFERLRKVAKTQWDFVGELQKVYEKLGTAQGVATR